MGRKNEAIPIEISQAFEEALRISERDNCLFLTNICSELNKPKSFFATYAEQYQSLEDKLELINTNLESNILTQTYFKHIDVRFAQFALEAIHGWSSDTGEKKSAKVLVEGITTEELNELLIGEDNDLIQED